VTSGFLETAPRGLRHLEHVMGVPVMFDICDPDVGVEALERAVRWLRWVDAIFSTYREDSEISRFNRGELPITDLHEDVRAVLRRCADLHTQTFGFFDIQAPYRSGVAPAAGDGGPGSVDPSGLVKGWAVAKTAEILRDAGARNFLINASIRS
jgi:thiamine biosynthesis lipoprotein